MSVLRRSSIAAVGAVLALAPAALAQSAGDDQYFDPLADERSPQAERPAGSGTGGGSGSGSGQGPSATPSPAAGGGSTATAGPAAPGATPATQAAAPAAATGTAPTAGATLPRTGASVVPMLVIGLVALLAGALLRVASAGPRSGRRGGPVLGRDVRLRRRP